MWKEQNRPLKGQAGLLGLLSTGCAPRSESTRLELSRSQPNPVGSRLAGEIPAAQTMQGQEMSGQQPKVPCSVPGPRLCGWHPGEISYRDRSGSLV